MQEIVPMPTNSPDVIPILKGELPVMAGREMIKFG
jgi:hypothetical protein